MTRLILMALLAASATFAQARAAGDAPGMAAAATGFYAVYATFHPSDGIPSAADRAKYRPYLSPALDALLGDAQAAEARFAKANKGAPPLVEGDLFTSLFEGASSVAVGDCSGDALRGRCTVKLEHTDKMSSPLSWNDTVLLVKTPTGWRVDDIAFGASWAFGNKGRLSELLKQAISFQ
jgi:hypothetical protein